MMPFQSRGATTLVLGLLTLASIACGDDATSPEATGEVEAAVTDAPENSSAAVAPDDADGPRALATGGSFSGTLTADATISISVDGSTWVDLGSPQSISLRMQSTGDTTDVHAAVPVPAGTYTRVRLELASARASIAAGSQIGGLLLDAAADLRLGGETVVIEKQVAPFTITADSRTRVVFDLNSEAWVTEENAQDETVEEEEVSDSCEAETQPAPRGEEMS